MENDNINYDTICISSYFVENDVVWFVSKDFNGLFRLNLNSYETVFVDFCPHRVFDRHFVYGGMTMLHDELYFSNFTKPGGAVKYNILTNKFKQLQNETSEVAHPYFICVNYNNYVYIFPYDERSIIRINTVTEETERLIEWYDEFLYDYGDEKIFGIRYAIFENLLFIPLRHKNAIFEFNMETLEYKWYSIGLENMNYLTVTYDGKYIWLSVKGKALIIKYDRKTGEYQEIDLQMEGNIYHSDMIYHNNYIWCIINQRDIIIKININSNSIEKLQLMINNENTPYYSKWRENDQYYSFCKYKKNLLIFSDKENACYVLNTNNNEIIKHMIKFPSSDFALDYQTLKKHFEWVKDNNNYNNNYFIEKNDSYIAYYLKSILDDKYNNHLKYGVDSNLSYGQRIYEKMKYDIK